MKGLDMITSKFQPCDKPKETYPILKKSALLIVLFTKERTGYVVSGDLTRDVGYYINEWNENQFTVFDGEVILTNT